MKSQTTRRQFLQTSTAAGAAFWVGNSFAESETTSPNEKLNIAVVGTQGRASGNIGQINKQNIVAFADVDSVSLGKRLKEFPSANRYKDFRKMFEKEDKNIDAVLVSSPDHIHAPATAMAIRMGKHAYCEKPLTHTIFEARTLAQLAKKHNAVTQMGTQIHAGNNYRRVVELIRSGAIGKVTEAYAWVGKGWADGRFKFGKPAPSRLDWDLWLGPTQKRPYTEGVHPASWRKFWDYGSGTLGDMGCHYIDLIFWALKLKHPTHAWAEGPAVHPVGAPRWCSTHWAFPARGEMPPMTVHWSDGGKRPDILATLKHKNGKPIKWGDGQLFVGHKGMILSSYSNHLLLPEDKFEGFEPPKQTIPNSIGHHNEWIQACKTGGKTTCNFEYSGALSETVLLGTVAFRVGKKIAWDAKNMQATNCPEANDLVHKEYRKGWSL